MIVEQILLSIQVRAQRLLMLDRSHGTSASSPQQGVSVVTAHQTISDVLRFVLAKVIISSNLPHTMYSEQRQAHRLYFIYFLRAISCRCAVYLSHIYVSKKLHFRLN